MIGTDGEKMRETAWNGNGMGGRKIRRGRGRRKKGRKKETGTTLILNLIKTHINLARLPFPFFPQIERKRNEFVSFRTNKQIRERRWKVSSFPKNSNNTLDTTRFAPLTILSPSAIARLRGDKRNDSPLGNSFRPSPRFVPSSHFSTGVDEPAELSVWHRFRGDRRWDDVDLFRSSVNEDSFCGN